MTSASEQAIPSSDDGLIFSPFVPWSPIVSRPPLRWPNGASLAVCVVLHVEHLEWLPQGVSEVPPSAVRRPPYPRLLDPHETSPHEYGNRVGFFRLLHALDSLGMPASIAMDAVSAQRYPNIVDLCRSRGWEFVGHGLSASRMITGAMSYEEELDYVTRSLDILTQATGSRPTGWAGIEYAESSRTVQALADAGLDYTIDWANDEQPYLMTTSGHRLVSLPCAIEVDDVYAIHMRRILTKNWAAMVRESVERLCADGRESGRLLVLNLHPWLSGQPFRMRHVEAVLAVVAERGDVWLTTGREVAQHYRSLELH